MIWRPRWWWGIPGFAVYFLLASWAKLSYVDPIPPGSQQLFRPFAHEAGLAWRIPHHPDGAFTVYEDSRPLQEVHSFAELSAAPRRFLHDGPHLLISSDRDPNRNGKAYWTIPK